MSQLTQAAFKQLQRFRAVNGISSPPASLSPPPPPERPLTPRENRRAIREMQRAEMIRVAVELICDDSRITFAPHRESLVRDIISLGARPGEIDAMRAVVQERIERMPHIVEREQKAPKVLPSFEAAVEKTNRMNSDVDGYVEFRRRNGLPILPEHGRPLPSPVVPQDRQPRPEPPPVSPADAAYNLARQALGLPPCNKASSDWYEQRQRERGER